MQLGHSCKIFQEVQALSKNDKLIKRFLSKPKDFTWDEFQKVFKVFGFEVRSGKGSGRSFVNDKQDIFFIHEPHPSNTMKPYAIKDAITFLTEKGLLG